jgi:hypothetical protein
MSDDGDRQDRPRPTPRPRPGPARPAPSPRPRVAGSRRDRDPEAAAPADRVARPAPAPRTRPAARAASVEARDARARRSDAAPPAAVPGRPRGRSRAVAALAVLCLLVAAGGGFLFWQRLHPGYVDASVFDATRKGVEALYAFDYQHPDKSIAGKLAVLTGDLRSQYDKDLKQGGIIDTYKQVSATTRYDVVDVGLQQIDDAQSSATLVVFGQYVVKSVNSGNQPAPQGSECTTTSDGAQSCTQTVQVHEVKVGGVWKISDLTLLTTT